MSFLKLTEIDKLFYYITTKILEESIPGRVRKSWPKDGQPDWQIDEDICFLRITETDDMFNRLRDIRYQDNGSDLTRKEQYTRVLLVSFILYGPNSFDRADDIRYKILLPDIKYLLGKVNVFPVPSIPAPIRAPELFQGQWWERSDLTIRFNQFIEREAQVPAIERAGIVIIEEDGKERNIDGSIT